MKRLLVIFLVAASQYTIAQELYVSTEPASNMAKGSIGLRLNSKLFKMNHDERFSSYRIEPEAMFGVNKRIMIHIAAYGSNMFRHSFRAEGASLYGKYRFFSQDEVHKHFRLAAYSKISVIKNPEALVTASQHLVPDGNGGFVAHQDDLRIESRDIDLDGNNSGIATGVVATKLVNKLALSASLGYTRRLKNPGYDDEISLPVHAATYTASAGYLLFPREYMSYDQTNCNIYLEVTGQSFPGKKQSYVDVAPAIQFIFNSISRVDIVYHMQMAGNISRLSNNYFMLRLEYNLLNAFGKK